MDAFYASVEQRDNPAWRKKPLVVGGHPDGRGVVATASYEARKYGIKSAMSCFRAKQLCPSAIFTRPRMEVYRQVSLQIREIFFKATPLVEPLSMDEAYLDVTENLLGLHYATQVAKYLKDEIFQTTGLTASAGVGPNKFIAKVASDLKKPNGLVVVPPEQVEAFVERLGVRQLWGVGPATAKKLESRGILTAHDIRQRSQASMQQLFGKQGRFLWELSHGRDERKVQPQRVRKSLGAETTFSKNIDTLPLLLEKLEKLVSKLSQRQLPLFKTVTVKLRFSDFKTITRSQTLANYCEDPLVLKEVATSLLKGVPLKGKSIRLVGCSVSHLYSPKDPHPKVSQLTFKF